MVARRGFQNSCGERQSWEGGGPQDRWDGGSRAAQTRAFPSATWERGKADAERGDAGAVAENPGGRDDASASISEAAAPFGESVVGFVRGTAGEAFRVAAGVSL